MRKVIPAFVAALFSISALAGQAGTDKATFESLDSNSDQKLSMSEAQAHQKLAAEFSQADANSDGFLSREEFDAYNQA